MARAKLRDVEGGTTSDGRDALGIVAWLLDRDRDGSLAGQFELDEATFGRVDGVPWREQLEFEGWILGV